MLNPFVPPVSPLAILSQLLAEFTRLPLFGLEGCFGVQELVQEPTDPGHVQLSALAALSQGGRLHPQLGGGQGELLAALVALLLHPLGIVQEGLHAHHHRVPLGTG